MTSFYSHFVHIITSFFLITACSIEEQTKVGPNDSFWLGGADGGVFIDIKDDDDPNDQIYVGTIYNDGDQTIWYQGPFKLVSTSAFAVDNRDLYSFWDGEKLYLKDGSYLEPVNPIPPHH